MRACVRECVCVCVRARARACVYPCIYIYIYMHNCCCCYVAWNRQAFIHAQIRTQMLFGTTQGAIYSRFGFFFVCLFVFYLPGCTTEVNNQQLLVFVVVVVVVVFVFFTALCILHGGSVDGHNINRERETTLLERLSNSINQVVGVST